MKNTIILGLAGEIACGKGTIVDILKGEFNVKVIRFSDCLRDVLKRLHIGNSRENMQNLSTVLRELFGQDTLSRVVLEDSKSSDADIVVLDGVRRLSDIEIFLKDPAFRMMYIEASIEKRYERIIKRGENTDELQKSFEEFVKDHEKEAESQIRELREHAHYVISNEGRAEELSEKIISLIYPIFQ